MQNSQKLSEKINIAIEILLSDHKKADVSNFLLPILLDLENITRDKVEDVLHIIKKDDNFNPGQKLLFVQVLIAIQDEKNFDKEIKAELEKYKRYLQSQAKILNFIQSYSNSGIDQVINLLNKITDQHSHEQSKAVVEPILTILKEDDEKFTDNMRLSLVTILIELEGGTGVNPPLDEYKNSIERTINKEKIYKTLINIEKSLYDVREQLDEQRKENEEEVPRSNIGLLRYLIENSQIKGSKEFVENFYKSYCDAAYKVLELSQIVSEQEKCRYLHRLSDLCFNFQTFKRIYPYICGVIPERSIELIREMKCLNDTFNSLSFVFENKHNSDQLSEAIHLFFQPVFLLNITNLQASSFSVSTIDTIFQSDVLNATHITQMQFYLRQSKATYEQKTNVKSCQIFDEIVKALDVNIAKAEKKLGLDSENSQAILEDLKQTYQALISQQKQSNMGNQI